jgi:uncharacterized delta-60 repeat protein
MKPTAMLFKIFLGSAVLILTFSQTTFTDIASSAAAGDLDPAFGSNGKVATDFGGSGDYVFAVALQPDGKIVAAGRKIMDSHSDFALARYNPDGSLDTSFANNGKVTTAFSATSSDLSYSIAYQPDGKIIVAGETGNYPIFDFALVRYTGDGQLDSSFGSNGKVATDFFGQSDQSYAVALQPDSKIVVAGLTHQGSSPLDFGLARYLSPPSCACSLSATSVHLPSRGGSGSVNLTTGSGCVWQATSNAGWITITSPSNGIGKGAVSYTVAANPGSGGRKGTVVVAGQTFSVKQKGS